MSSLIKTLFNVISKRNSFHCLRRTYSVFLINNKPYHNHRIRSSYSQTLVIHNRMMASASAIQNIGIDQLKKYQENKAATIIDVREVEEINETGVLPGGINIPLGDVCKALKEDPDVFEKKYHHHKPSLESPIIFSCRSGKRSLMASEQALSLGYHNVLNFAGGWIEWEKHLPK